MRPQLAFPLQFLTQPQIESLHQAILSVLWETGVRVEWRPALEIYAEAGCRVDFAHQLVQIPGQVLEQALKTAPASFSLYGSTPANEIHVTLEDVYTIAGSSNVMLSAIAPRAVRTISCLRAPTTTIRRSSASSPAIR